MQYSDLYKLCQRQSGNTTSDALIGFQLYLNLAQREIAAALDNWQELQAEATLNATQGVEQYVYTTALSDMRKVWISSPVGYSRVLPEMNYQKFRDLYASTANDGQGTPKLFYFSPGTPGSINIFPVPDQAYTITYDYIKIPSDMTADTDTPFFPARWHHVLVDYALALHYESPIQRDHNVANKYWTKWQNDLETLEGDTRLRDLNPLPIEFGSGVNEGYGTGQYFG